jgi:hypothetical protein
MTVFNCTSAKKPSNPSFCLVSEVREHLNNKLFAETNTNFSLDKKFGIRYTVYRRQRETEWKGR